MYMPRPAAMFFFLTLVVKGIQHSEIQKDHSFEEQILNWENTVSTP